MILRPTPQDYDELLTVWEASVRSTHHFLAEKDIQFYKPLIREQYFLAVELYIIRNEKEEIAAFMGQACRFYQHMGFQVAGWDETDPTGKPFPILHLQLPTPPQITQIEHRL